MASMPLRWSTAIFCYLNIWDFAWTSVDLYIRTPNSTAKPGFPIPVNPNDPGVRTAARFGVYRYNNSSNDIFLFKESHINKATVQIVRGLKYTLYVKIGRTVCDKREQPNLDRCGFQSSKALRQTFQCYFEVWLVPWLQKVHVPVSVCR
uniref:Cystatin F n=1 Tax=Sphenodon punctatus TaxID=8508 RepID=A0A8D0HAC1_SPHPU